MAKGRDEANVVSERDERVDREANAAAEREAERVAVASARAAEKEAADAKKAADARAEAEAEELRLRAPMGGGTLSWPVEVERLEHGLRLSVGRYSIDLDGELLKAVRARLQETGEEKRR